ncbi:hypothetical protein, partial [Escherichia coli]
TSLKTSIKTITYLSDTGCLEIQGASLPAPIVAPVARAASVVDSPEVLHDRSLLGSGSKPYFFAHFLMLFGADE